MHKQHVLMPAFTPIVCLNGISFTIHHKVKESLTIGSFKNKLLSLICPPPKPVCSIHDPKGLAMLKKLRVGLSLLNLHQFRHNFRDTLNPLCPSNDGAEDTEHFLRNCDPNDAYRRDLLDNLTSTLQLYGLPNLMKACPLILIQKSLKQLYYTYATQRSG